MKHPDGPLAHVAMSGGRGSVDLGPLGPETVGQGVEIDTKEQVEGFERLLPDLAVVHEALDPALLHGPVLERPDTGLGTIAELAVEIGPAVPHEVVGRQDRLDHRDHRAIVTLLEPLANRHLILLLNPRYVGGLGCRGTIAERESFVQSRLDK